MKITKFLNIKLDPLSPEMELEVELQCREIMKSKDIESVKRFCTHLIRKKVDQDILLTALLEKLIDFESRRLFEKKNSNNFFKFLKRKIFYQ